MFALGALGVLIALAVPFFSMRQGTADYSTDPTATNTTTYRAFTLLQEGFGPGFSGPLQLVAPIRGPAGRSEFARVVGATPNFHHGLPAIPAPAGAPVARLARPTCVRRVSILAARNS